MGISLSTCMGMSRSGEPSAAPTIPATITSGQWTLADSPSAGGNTLTVTLLSAPANGGSAITSYEFRRNGGAWSTLPGGTGLGARSITVLATTLANIEIQAVNAVDATPDNPSDSKSATPTVSDVTAPTISSTSPDDNATGVSATVSPTITFNEAVAFGTGLITLRENNGGWADLETFDVVTEVGTGNGQVSISGAVLTINPTASLTAEREYAIRIAATAIDDLAANSFAGVADDTTISFTAAAAASPISTTALSTATHMGIDLALGATYDVGTYSDGMGVFIVAPGGITAAGQTPAFSASPRDVNGAMKNPTGTEQAFDAYVDVSAYNAGLRATYPLSLAAKDCVVICESFVAATSEDRNGVPANFGMFFVVDAAPVVGTLTPPAFWPTPATRPMNLVADAASIVAAAPRTSATGLGVTAWATAKTPIQRPAPLLGMLPQTSTGGYQSAFPRDFGIYGSSNNYGEGITWAIDRAILGAILTDAYSTADAEEAVYTLLGHGLQWGWGIESHAVSFTSDGGHRAFALFCMALAADHLGNTDVRDWINSDAKGNYTMGVRAGAQMLNDTWNPHNNNSRNSTGRIREAGVGTTSSVVKFQTFTGDPANWRVTGNIMRRLSDGASAVLGSNTLDDAGGFISVSYTGTAFTAGDLYTMEPAYPIDIGDYLWAARGDVSDFTPSNDTSYFVQQPWTATLAGIVALGIPDTGLVDAIQIMLRANEANEPTGYDYPSFAGQTPVADWYAAQGATLFASYLAAPSDTTAPTASAYSFTALSSTTAQINITTDEGNGGIFYVLTASATPPTAAQIRLRQDHTSSPALFFGSVDVTSTGAKIVYVAGLTPSTLYYCHTVLTDLEKNSSAVQTDSDTTAATGTTFIEDWGGYTVGDVNAQVTAGGYTFSGNPPNVTITADVESSSGKALYGTGITASLRGLSRDDINATLASGWTTLEVLFKVRTNPASGCIWGMGIINSTTVAHGVRVSRGASTTGITLIEDTSWAAVGAQTLATGLADDEIYWVRFQFSGGNIRGRAWVDGGSEPGSYGADLAVAGALAGEDLSIVARSSTGTFVNLGYSVGVDAAAPSF